MIGERVPEAGPRPGQLLPRLIAGAAIVGLGLALGWALTSDSWELLITAVAWTTLVGAVLLDPLLGLLLWVIASPFAPFVHLNLSLGAGIPDLSLDRLAAGFFCLVLLAQVARQERKLAPLEGLDIAVLLFASALVLSARAALRGTFSALQSLFDAHLVPLLIYFLAKNLVRTKRQVRWLIGSLGVIAGYLVLLTINEHLTGNELFVVYGRVSEYGENLRRVNSLLQNPAYIALALDLILPFALRATFLSQDRSGRWLGALSTLVLLGTIFSLYNRAGWLGALLVIVVSALHYRQLRRWLLLAVATLTPVAALSWTIIRNSPVFAERLTYDLSIDYRLRALDAVLTLVQRNPLFGIGFGNFSILSLREGLITSYTTNYWIPTTHNSYLDVLASAGLTGLVPFLAIFALVAWKSWHLFRKARQDARIDRSLIVALWAAFLAFCVTIATLDLAAAPFCAMVFWLIVGGVLGSQSHVASLPAKGFLEGSST